MTRFATGSLAWAAKCAGRSLGVGPQRLPLDLRGLAPGAYHFTGRQGSRRNSQLLGVN